MNTCRLAFVALAFSVVLSACGPKSGGPNPQATTTAAPPDPMKVKLSAEQQSSYPTHTVQLRPVADVQSHPGRIEANEQRVSRVGSGVVGRISSVNVELGDMVKPGQVLARLTSPELTSAQLSFLRAHSNLTQAERAVDRARQMIQADVISSAELQKRESAQTTFGSGVFATNGATLNFALGTSPWSAVSGGGTANAAASSKISTNASGTFNMSSTAIVNASFLGSLRDGASFTLVDASGGTGLANTLRDNSYVMGSSLSRGTTNPGNVGDLILTVNRTASDYVTLSNTTGHFSNNAALRLGAMATVGTGYTADVQTALNKLDIDQWGYGNNQANLATQVKRLAPIANNSLAQSAFGAVALGNASVANRVQELRNSSEGQADAQGVWIKSDYARGSQAAKGDYDGYTNRTSGLSVGYDMRPDAQSIVGVALGYNGSTVQQRDFRSGDKATIGTTLLSAYAGYNFTKEAFLDGSLTHGWQDFDSDRSTIVGRTANAGFNGRQLLGRLSAGYRFQLEDTVTTLTPLVSIEQATLRQNAYTESGAGDIGWQVVSQSLNRKQTALGLRYTTITYAGGVQIKPEVTLASGRENSNLNQGLSTTFIGDTSGTSVQTPTLDPSKRFSAVGVGATMVMSNTSSLLLRVDNSQRAGLKTQSLSLVARWEL
ncbi:MAG: autotransporter domain-containing protein [Alphaproteobacteria bacterium]|nr:autotransporter domain-containing protein [Alphaproteobacteria bacterium]